MLTRLLRSLLGIFTALLYTLNLLFWSVILYLAALIKLVYRSSKGRALFEKVGHGIAKGYAVINDVIIKLTCPTVWEIDDTSALSPNTSYLLLSNHQSWADIVILEKVFVRRTSMLKFFLKEELRWIPLVGTTCWAFNFPFMKRYSQAFLEKNPHLRGHDLEITKKACALYQTSAVTLINFAEGTRFRPDKHKKQQSPYQYLLKPKAGGASFAITAMNGKLTEILDVTIIYHSKSHSMWDFLCGRIPKISVHFRTYPITAELIGDYHHDEAFRADFQNWMNARWAEKDALMIQECKND